MTTTTDRATYLGAALAAEVLDAGDLDRLRSRGLVIVVERWLELMCDDAAKVRRGSAALDEVTP
jgi:hypothetical protein